MLRTTRVFWCLVAGGMAGTCLQYSMGAAQGAFLGICLGLQCAVIEIARNVLGLVMLFTEFNRYFKPVIALMPEAKGIQANGAEIVGLYECRIAGFDCKWAYGREVTQDHRHDLR